MADDCQQKPPIDSKGNATSPSGPAQSEIKRKNSPDNDHGNRFQSKLLFLFFIRAINQSKKAKENNEEGYEFQLATELEEYGGKFDDLVFRKDFGKEKQEFLYLQAKHRLHEKPDPRAKSITASDLLNDNKGDFSLIKYFHSYRDNVMKAKEKPNPADIVDCVISTNIDFDEEELTNNGIYWERLSRCQLNEISREMLTFEPIERSIKEEKDNKTNGQQNYYEIANFLLQCATNQNYKPSKHPQLIQRYKAICDTLGPNEKIIDVKEDGKMKFHEKFIAGDQNLSSEAKKLWEAIVKKTSQKTNEEKNKNKEYPHRDLEIWEFPMNPIDFSNKIPTCYRIKPIRWLDLHFVANVLRDCELSSATSTRKKLDQQGDAFKRYHVALVEEKVIVPFDSNTKDTMKFSQDFIGGNQLTNGAKELRKIIEKFTVEDRTKWTDWTFEIDSIDSFDKDKTNGNDKRLDDDDTKNDIEEFFNNKLIFAINTPNEEELNPILKKEVGKKFNLVDADLESTYILNQMVNWFKRIENVWLTAKDGNEILLAKTNQKLDSLRATSFSLDYQKELDKILSFNRDRITKMTDNLKKFIDSSNLDEKLKRIATPSPKFTAVKVITALKTDDNLKLKFECDDSFLVTSLSRLQKGGHEKEWMKNALLTEGNPHQLLVIVNDNGVPFQSTEVLFNVNESENLKLNKVIVIETNSTSSPEDDISYEQLSEKTKEYLMSKTVSFQGNDATVRDLIGDLQSDKVVDLQSMEEFLLTEEKERKSIPSHKRSQFEESLYIKRKLTFDFEFNWKEIADAINKNKKENERKTNAEELQGLHGDKMKQGNVEWIKGLEKNVKRTILQGILETRNAKEKTDEKDEDELINEEKWERRAVIIKGVAGTGKSTVLSHYYDAIKQERKEEDKKKENVWVIRIDLKDHFKSLAEFEGKTNLSGAIEFIANVVGISTHNFGRSLLTHRLDTGDRIVLMLDGFDEIDDTCKKIAMKMMTSITERKSTRLYVTTRPDVADNLQLKLGQLSYTLANFSEEDQIQYLSSFWIAKLGSVKEEENKRIREIAKSLVERVANDLKDEEKSFVGVPLQCRIVAECFLNEVQTDIEETRNGTGKQSETIGQHQKFDLVSLYRKLMETKRQVFRKEKINTESAHEIVQKSLNLTIKQIERHLSKLSVRTIISDGRKVDILCPKQYRSKSESQEEMVEMDELCVRFGLADRVDNKLEFLHRTYAEYLVADYLFKGFKLDKDEHNGLMEDESVRQLIGEEILVKYQYSGVRIFLNSMLKEIVDSDKWCQIEGETAANLPKRLIKFADENPPACVCAVENKNSNIFIFLFDCLQAASNQTKIQQLVESAFPGDFPADIYYEQSSRVFERIIKYYDIEKKDKVKFILDKMLRYSDSLLCSDWRHDQEERKNVLKLVLDFMEKANVKGTLKKFLDPKLNGWKLALHKDADVLHFLICQDGFEKYLKQFLQIFSSVYPDTGEALWDLFKELFTQDEDPYDEEEFQKKCRKIFTGKTQNALIILRDLGREELVSKMSHLVIKRDAVSFANVY